VTTANKLIIVWQRKIHQFLMF